MSDARHSALDLLLLDQSSSQSPDCPAYTVTLHGVVTRALRVITFTAVQHCTVCSGFPRPCLYPGSEFYGSTALTRFKLFCSLPALV